MRVPAISVAPLGVPQLLHEATELAALYRALAPSKLATLMKISTTKAAEVQHMYAHWSDDPAHHVPAIDAFVGDIYSGLQVQSWSAADRMYAQQHLLILSGLYGGLRACDGIAPYRLEMAYKLPDGSSLYTYWGSKIAALLSVSTSTIINLSAVEYTKAVLPYTDTPVVAPKFLTVSPKTGGPTFVTVHAKIARGAFAGWLVRQRVDDVSRLYEFTDLGYKYDEGLSTLAQPVFVCQKFEGLGLSVRLTK